MGASIGRLNLGRTLAADDRNDLIRVDKYGSGPFSGLVCFAEFDQRRGDFLPLGLAILN